MVATEVSRGHSRLPMSSTEGLNVRILRSEGGFISMREVQKKNTTYVTEDMPVAKSRSYKEYSKEVQESRTRQSEM